jgi:hypothetical protein
LLILRTDVIACSIAAGVGAPEEAHVDLAVAQPHGERVLKVAVGCARVRDTDERLRLVRAIARVFGVASAATGS